MEETNKTGNPEANQPKPSSKRFFKDLFAVDKVDFSQAIKNIKSDVSFKGFNVWILICSILICSLGLNLNSPAVVIGAMLISPLMGPIVGVGLGVGIYDPKLIFRALKNLGIAAGISILTAFIFFKITPTDDVSEILSRTRPTLLDLFVAFFGGIAGILAASRNISTNVVPGVAIATALMPPLCTAGYGLASGHYDYFAGALYLFIMNSIMISLAAVIIVWYLRYPKFSFVDASTKNNVKRGIILAVIVVTVPSCFFYYNILQENLMQDRVAEFVTAEIEEIPGVYVNNQKIITTDTGTTVLVNLSGNYMEKDDILALESKMRDYKLVACRLKIAQSEPVGFKEQRLASLKNDIITELYQNSNQKLVNKDDEIELLKSEIQRLSGEQLVAEKIDKLAKSQFDVEEMAVDILVYRNDEKLDTIPTALVRWESFLNDKEIEQQTEKLKTMLSISLETERINVFEIK